jgi:hypothetical protein
LGTAVQLDAILLLAATAFYHLFVALCCLLDRNEL